MKKNLFILVAFLASATICCAQSTKEQMKERMELYKMGKEELNQKASKDARKEARRLEKEGWQIAPGALPIAKQLDRVYIMKYEIDDDMFPKWIMGEAMSIGESYDAAKMQALALAAQNLAGEIGREVTELVKNKRDNQQLSPEEATSVIKTISESAQMIQQSIGRTVTVTEMYRTLKNKNKEVRVMIAYNKKMAKEAARKAVRDDLEKEGEALSKKLDGILGW